MDKSIVCDFLGATLYIMRHVAASCGVNAVGEFTCRSYGDGVACETAADCGMIYWRFTNVMAMSMAG